MLDKPNLFIIGTAKSGTTALASFLDVHPEIFISKPKEPGYFCSDLHEESNRYYGKYNLRHFEFQNREDYLKLFYNVDNHKILGEASTNYIYSKTSAKEIFDFNSRAKIILSIREPVEFLHSLHMQYVNDTSEDEKDFKKALELETSRKKGRNLNKRVRTPSYLYYSERIKYSLQIQRYLNVFPNEQIKIILFDDFKNDNKKVYKDVLRFLGVDDSFKPDFKGVHESKMPRSLFLNKVSRTPYLTRIPKVLLSENAYDKLQLSIQKILMKRENRQPLNPDLRKELMIKFKPKVVKLEKLLHEEGFLPTDRSLISEWGYGKV